jgi:hypothetical protein
MAMHSGAVNYGQRAGPWASAPFYAVHSGGRQPFYSTPYHSGGAWSHMGGKNGDAQALCTCARQGIIA